MIIRIKNLRIDAHLGVYEWEKDFSRALLFNVEIETDQENSMKSDELEDTIDYDKITNQIKEFTQNNHCKLIEKLTNEILHLIMQDLRIKRCTLEVDKLKVYDFVDSYSIVKTKSR
jgi:7,8-dihydroneopterin aldolase/epimerase/oxygenase